MRKHIPLLILLAVALGLLFLYGPGWYQSYLFRRTAHLFCTAAAAGDTAGWTGMIDPAQLPMLQGQLAGLPADYAADIESFKLSRYERSGAGTVWAVFTCHLAESAGGGVYQGKLRWRWQDGHWAWDFSGSYAAPFSPSGEPEWVKLGDLLRLLEAL